MVSYDVQAHPFNRAPSANPQMILDRNGHTPATESELTGGSSRSSVWSVELETGSCGCISGYFLGLLRHWLIIGYGIYGSVNAWRDLMIPIRTNKYTVYFIFGYIFMYICVARR